MMMPISPIASSQFVQIGNTGRSLKRASSIGNNSLAKNGFTLIELLLAITIGSVVMGAVYATFITAVNSQQRVQRAAAASQASRYFMELMRRDVKQLAATADALTGSGQQLNLVFKLADGTIQKVGYSHRSEDGQGEIVRSATTSDKGVETVAYEGVASLGFRYFVDGDWHTESNQSVLPQAIECALEIGAWVQRFTVTLEVENVPIKG